MARTTRPRDARAGRMLAVEVGAELLAALRDEAARRDQPLATLVRRLLATGLQDAREGVSADPGRLTALETIVEGLAARVVALEQSSRSAPAAAGEHSPDRVMPPPSDAPLVSVALARQLGISASALNKLASSKGIGARHRSGWTVAAKVPGPGGPDRWLWSPPPPPN